MSEHVKSDGEIVVYQGPEGSLSIQETMKALDDIRKLVAATMVDGTDYGVIPGAGNKKVLLLPGAQKIAMRFNCRPEFVVEKTSEHGDGHVEFTVTCKLISRSTNNEVAQGVGSCTTMESKYRFRNAERLCPSCKAPAIIKGKAEYGGGWLCWQKKGGCNAKFPEDHPLIVEQQVGKVENDNVWDLRNTVLKMAKKRAAVDASISLSCMSELFTQDIEKDEHHEGHSEPPKPAAAPAKAKPTAPPQPEYDADLMRKFNEEMVTCENEEQLRAVWNNVIAADRKIGVATIGPYQKSLADLKDKAKLELANRRSMKAAAENAPYANEEVPWN